MHHEEVQSRIVFVDAHLVVVDKPPGMDTVPFDGPGRSRPPSRGRRGRLEPPRDSHQTLVERLAAELSAGPRPRPLHVVQRLDRETSGVLVFARRPEAARHLQQQLRMRTVHRRYLALAHGVVQPGKHRSFLGGDRGDGKRGSLRHARFGQEAITHVEVLERFHGATLVQCRLETGRTHQIRIHLGEAGHPLVGERTYGRAGDRLPLVGIPVPRLLLHAAELGFVHPVRETLMRFECPIPADMHQVLERMRGTRESSG